MAPTRGAYGTGAWLSRANRDGLVVQTNFMCDTRSCEQSAGADGGRTSGALHAQRVNCPLGQSAETAVRFLREEAPTQFCSEREAISTSKSAARLLRATALFACAASVRIT